MKRIYVSPTGDPLVEGVSPLLPTTLDHAFQMATRMYAEQWRHGSCQTVVQLASGVYPTRPTRARRLSEKQLRTLRSVREATDRESAFHRSGAANAAGLVAVGSTISSLEKRGLVKCGGTCTEVDGDGFTVREDAYYYEITAAGRDVLLAADQQRDIAEQPACSYTSRCNSSRCPIHGAA